MERRAILAAFWGLVGAGCSVQLPWSGADSVSLINLIATPARFNGRRVRVIGYLHLEFEGDAIYLDQESFDNGVDANAIWVNLPAWATVSKTQPLNDKYVLIQGQFDASDHGHMGQFAGSIDQIERLELWAFRNGRPVSG
jgi:hypothetical protein